MEWDPKRFPDPAAMLAQLKDLNIKVRVVAVLVTALVCGAACALDVLCSLRAQHGQSDYSLCVRVHA